MAENQALRNKLLSGAFDKTLALLNGSEGVENARVRCEALIEGYCKTFGSSPQSMFSSPGRTELGGNHTDHQRGRVLAASINLDILAAVSLNQSSVIRVQSQGYPLKEVSVGELSARKDERGDSVSLIRGIMARFKELGCELQGMDIYTISNVPQGSGLSSSAAFEVLIGTILNHLCWDTRLSPTEIAQVGQYAENVYFGKPCGLMDQTASSVGGVVAIDFADALNPQVEQVPFDFAATGYALCILDSGADHSDLTGDYAAITEELRAVCGYFSKDVLREVPEHEFLPALPRLRQLAGDRAVLRAMHFYAEDCRAAEQALALKNGNFESFLRMADQSGISSGLYLQNVVPLGRTVRQELMLAIALSKRILMGKGAARVHGGGFGGTAQAFVPTQLVPEFKRQTESVLGKGSCHVLSIRPAGAVKFYTQIDLKPKWF